MNRAERRRNGREKEKTYTYKESELRNIILNETEKREEYYYHMATKLLIIAAIHSLKNEFKFGKDRITKFIDGITNVYQDISSDKDRFTKYVEYVENMGIEIKFLEEIEV